METVNTMKDFELRYLNRRGGRWGRSRSHASREETDIKVVDVETKPKRRLYIDAFRPIR